jgi:MFS family permease
MNEVSTSDQRSIAAGTRSHGPITLPVYLYFGPLTMLIYLCLPHGYLIDIATSFMLKNQLHASASQIASFRLLTALPVYFAWVFGLIRDQWSPLGLKDRGFFLLFAPLTAAVFIGMALLPLSYTGLFIGMLLVMMTFRLVTAAYQGLIALIGQEKRMSGRLSALLSIGACIPAVGGALLSGYLVEHVEPRRTFLLMGTLTLLIGLLGFWKPRAVFDHAYERPQAKRVGFVADIRRLLKHRAIYPAVLVMFLLQFTPGANTPLQFYLTNQLHSSDATYAYFNGIFMAAFIPVYFLYGFLCKKYSLQKLLFWGVIITIPQYVPLAFIHSADTALLWAIPIGMMGAISVAAAYDLAMRSCPSGLQGTLMMLIDGVFQLSYRGSDILGTSIYNSSASHGFLYCVICTALVYALVIPVLLMIPKEIVTSVDGVTVQEIRSVSKHEL